MSMLLVSMFAIAANPEIAPSRFEVHGQIVLRLTGSPRDQGLEQGRSLAKEIRSNIAELVDRHAVEAHGMTKDQLDAMADAQIASWPAALQEELAGIAEGSQLPLADIRRLQVIDRPIPSRAGAAYGSRTLGGRLIHLVTVEPGHPLRASSAILVRPKGDGLACVTVGWAGCIGATAGLNEEGISVSAIEVPSQDSAEGGLSGPILNRLILASAKTLPGVRTTVDAAPRSGAWSLLAGDGKVPAVRALECTPKGVAEFGPNDTAERLPPFKGLADIIRRSNQFISKELAQHTALELPWQEKSLARYNQLASLLDVAGKTLGAVDAIHALRQATADQPPVQLLAINASDRELWVGLNDAKENAASAAVVGYRWQDLFSGQSLADQVSVDTPEKPIDPESMRRWAGSVTPRRSQESSVPKMYQLSTESFDYTVMPDAVRSGVARLRVEIPSPVTTPYPENNTIPVEVFRPRDGGVYPYIIVTHIAGGDFELSRFVATTFASNGLACAFVKLPFYGERRPPGKEIRMLQADVDIASGAMIQAIKDLRRVVDWIETQPDLAPGKIGICGISLGSITGALAAGIEPRMTHACLIIGGGSLHDLIFESIEGEARGMRRKWLESGGTRESLGELMKSYDPVTYRERLRERVVLMINASQDESVPVVCGKALWEAAGKQRIIWYPCGHYTIVRYIMPALQHTVQFFKTWPDRDDNVDVQAGG